MVSLDVLSQTLELSCKEWLKRCLLLVMRRALFQWDCLDRSLQVSSPFGRQNWTSFAIICVKLVGNHELRLITSWTVVNLRNYFLLARGVLLRCGDAPSHGQPREVLSARGLFFGHCRLDNLMRSLQQQLPLCLRQLNSLIIAQIRLLEEVFFMLLLL